MQTRSLDACMHAHTGKKAECPHIYMTSNVEHLSKAHINFLSTCKNIAELTFLFNMQVSKQGSASLTFILLRIKSKGSNTNMVYWIMTSSLSKHLYHAWQWLMSLVCNVLYCVDDTVIVFTSFFPWQILASHYEKLWHVGWMGCTCLFMFFAVITNLYCLHDLVFLPDINHCQEERGLVFRSYPRSNVSKLFLNLLLPWWDACKKFLGLYSNYGIKTGIIYRNNRIYIQNFVNCIILLPATKHLDDSSFFSS